MVLGLIFSTLTHFESFFFFWYIVYSYASKYFPMLVYIQFPLHHLLHKNVTKVVGLVSVN